MSEQETIDHSNEATGGLPRIESEPRTLALVNYRKTSASMPLIPVNCDWTTRAHNSLPFVIRHGRKKYDWDPMRNKTEGSLPSLNDCTVAFAGHSIQVWTSNADITITVTDQQIVDAYLAVSPNGQDNGAVMEDVLKYWRTTGIGDHKIDAYTKLTPGDRVLTKEAVALFGTAYIALMLPNYARVQARLDRVD